MEFYSYKSIIVKTFLDLSEIESRKGRYFPSRAFKNSATQVESATNYEVEGTRVVLSNSDGIMVLGNSSSDVFLDIINTGSSSRLNSEIGYLVESTDLTNISGIGEVKAAELYLAGIKSAKELDDLKLSIGDKIPNTNITFSQNIDTGLKFYLATGNERIPRDLAYSYLVDFKNNLVNKGIENFEMYPVGSYRRGRDTVGDLDIILTSTKDKEITSSVFDVVVDWLDLTLVNGETKTAGIKGKTQVDVRLIDRKYLGAHILHGTGSQSFNIGMRSIAKSLGLRLNEYGIVKDDELITFDSEKDVFSYLGISYVPPNKRELWQNFQYTKK